jgi:hypothetical protein
MPKLRARRRIHRYHQDNADFVVREMVINCVSEYNTVEKIRDAMRRTLDNAQFWDFVEEAEKIRITRNSLIRAAEVVGLKKYAKKPKGKQR